MSRRNFVVRSAIAAAAAGLGLPLVAEAAEKKRGKKGKKGKGKGQDRRIPVGLQVYSVRQQAAKDLAAVLAAVSRIGYKGVEFAGYYDHKAADIRKMLDDNGLVACGTHTPYESILPEKLAETIEFNQTIGNKYLIVPWMQGKTKQEWLDKAKLFNDVAEKVKPHGMWVGYHAHAHDFQKIGDQSAWDIFFGSTRKEVVMQLDTSNCVEGGADPVEVLKRYPGRARTIHLKANGGGPEAVIGEDKVNWSEVFKFCEGEGQTEWYIVEHESSKDPMDAVKRSFDALKSMGKI
jgi:sugar phosphate isomerase/epimerase